MNTVPAAHISKRDVQSADYEATASPESRARRCRFHAGGAISAGGSSLSASPKTENVLSMLPERFWSALRLGAEPLSSSMMSPFKTLHRGGPGRRSVRQAGTWSLSSSEDDDEGEVGGGGRRRPHRSKTSRPPRPSRGRPQKSRRRRPGGSGASAPGWPTMAAWSISSSDTIVIGSNELPRQNSCSPSHSHISRRNRCCS
mmetsp:Transcript_48749/g.105793  ORF Transcript_48749/g.105793 Transcript_48749/m.105793 type:complete len:200 (+) Transcript_48749:29-628(+)